MTQDPSQPQGDATNPAEAQTPAATPKKPRKKTASAKSLGQGDQGHAADSNISGDVAAKKTASRRRSTDLKFYKSTTSSFADGYDIERERLELLSTINRAEAGETIAASDPTFDRYMLFLDRQKDLARLTQQRLKQAEQPSQVTREEVKAYRALGGLVNAAEDDDTVTLHTKEAFQLFIGRASDPDNLSAPKIISFKKAGAAYRLLWSLSTNNNPYADWALIDLSQRRQALQKELARSVASMEETLQNLRQKRGLNFVVAQNPTPQALPVRFKSPYGYAMVECLAEFDYLVRLIRTLVFKARLTTPLADQLIRDHMRLFRAHFNEVKRFERYLGDEQLLLLTRNDFLPAADDVARSRVSKCIETFGQVPKSVFSLQVVPEFKSHRGDVSDAEKELLKKVTSGVLDDIDNDEAKTQEAGAAGLL